MNQNSETIQRLVASAHRYHSAVSALVAFMDRSGPAGRDWVKQLHQHEVDVEQARVALTAVALLLADEATEHQAHCPRTLPLPDLVLPTAKA